MIQDMKILGNGEFTLENMTSGGHITFRVKTCRKSKNPVWVGKRIWALMVGRDNTADFVNFAHLEGETLVGWRRNFSINKLNPRSGESFTLDELLVLVRFVMENGKFGALHCEGATVSKKFVRSGREYVIYRSCRCVRCNRLLTNPESIVNGIGPECATR